jgi:hypothetical protein
MSVAHVEPVTLELDAARQFDFWLGEWDCLVDDSGRHLGTNSVYLDLGGVVVVENFDGRPSLDRGFSFSVYDRKARRWKQTWVDSQGGYLDFVGGFADGVMELRRDGESTTPGRRSACAGRTSSATRSTGRGNARTTAARRGTPLGDRVHACRLAGSTSISTLYARREEERLAERLLTRLRDRGACGGRPRTRLSCASPAG